MTWRACVALLGVLAGCGTRDDRGVTVWVTTADRTQLLARQAEAPHAVSGDAPIAIAIDTTRRFQVMAGFGAAMTDASAHVIGALPTPARDSLLHDLFGASGAGFSFMRLTIGASDFSAQHRTLDDVERGDDPALRRFDIAPAAPMLDMARRAKAINPHLTIMATPWSAPAWMKTPRALNGGTLRPDVYGVFAQYLLRAIEAFDSASVPVDLLSLQNEPHHEPPDYPGMRLSPAQRAELLGRYVGPLFAQARPATSLLDWDHNWDEPDSPLAVLADSVARRYVDGVAWHCYAGDVSAQATVHAAHPDKDTWFTECSGGEWAANFGDNLLWNVRHLVIGTTRAWARGVLLWNIALDERHGPHNGGCTNCRGVVTVNAATGAITRNEEYYALSHASRFVHPGAVRIASTSRDSSLAHVAFVETDGTRVLILLNEAAAARTAQVNDGARTFPVTLPARAVATVTWRE